MKSADIKLFETYGIKARFYRGSPAIVVDKGWYESKTYAYRGGGTYRVPQDRQQSKDFLVLAGTPSADEGDARAYLAKVVPIASDKVSDILAPPPGWKWAIVRSADIVAPWEQYVKDREAERVAELKAADWRAGERKRLLDRSNEFRQALAKLTGVPIPEDTHKFDLLEAVNITFKPEDVDQIIRNAKYTG